MTTNTLLPMGSTLTEKRVASVLRQAVQNQISIADLLNPDRCPEPFLPYLAWAFSVDKWDEHWSDTAKRTAIKHAFYIHKHKGTIAALKRVVLPIGELLEIKEWWQMQPMGQAGTFEISIDVSEDGINESTQRELFRLVDDVKPVSRQMTLNLVISPFGIAHSFLAHYDAEILTIYPA